MSKVLFRASSFTLPNLHPTNPNRKKAIPILDIKKTNPSPDTSELENELEILVYRLYNLTYEEVLIIDADFELSKEEYEVRSAR